MHKPKSFGFGTISGLGLGTQSELILETFAESLNVHGFRARIGIATPTSPAYIAANWALLCIPEYVSTVPTLSDALINAEDAQALVWACGKQLVDDNQSYDIDLELMTSRNCEKGSRLSLVLRHETTFSGTTPTLNSTIGATWWETQI